MEPKLMAADDDWIMHIFFVVVFAFIAVDADIVVHNKSSKFKSNEIGIQSIH